MLDFLVRIVGTAIVVKQNLRRNVTQGVHLPRVTHARGKSLRNFHYDRRNLAVKSRNLQ